MAIYLLTHSYSIGKDKFYDEVRNLGIYSSRKKARKALKKYRKKKGFKFHLDGFYIEKWEVDKNFQWKEGFGFGCIKGFEEDKSCE